MKTDFIVIFDLDGLILDTECIARDAWRHASVDVGHEVTPEVVQHMVGRTLKDIQGILTEHLDKSAPIEALWKRANHHYHRLMDEVEPALKPGVHELFDFLEGRQVPKGLATSSNSDQLVHKLRGKNLLARLSHTICGDQIKHGKPAPDIFLELAGRFDHAPEACFVFEDSAPGIQAASAAGMRPLLVPDHGTPHPETAALAEAVFDSLHEAIPYLEQHL
jgi:HAD superfamily hydrolase (TIGR01509 family)